MTPDRRALLVLDTATDRTVVAVRAHPGGPIRDGSASVPERGAAALGIRLAAILEGAEIAARDLAAVGCGTGPGSFTGLRVGLSTAKTLAWSLGVGLVGIPTVDALRVAASAQGVEAEEIAVVQAAGARDHYLALPGEGVRLVPPDTDLRALLGTRPTIALGADPARLAGVRGPGGSDPAESGERARSGLGPALLALLERRLADGAPDDVATLVPLYVALPRGVTPGDAAGWMPALR